MTTQINQLITTPEGKTLEFKRDLSSPKPLLKTLVAFANTAGGKLIIGIDDDRQIFGVEQPLDEEEKLCNLIADSISPRLVPNVEFVTVEGKTLLVIEVFLSNTRPHYLKSEGASQGVYVRLGSSNRQADSLLIAELQRGVAGVSFDSLPMVNLSMDDLDLPAIREDFRNRPVDERMLQSLKILIRDQDRLVPTQGGILLYGKERRFHFDDAWIQCGRFIGNDKGDIFDHIDIHDPLPKAVDSIMLFLKKHAMRGADFSEIRRKDIWSIPINILREVVINGLVHADYSQRGTPHRIAFFDDRIEVESPGLLLPGLTIEEMKQGVSHIRNPVIARVFKELNLIEQWGSGIPGIFREAKADNLPEPIIEEFVGRVRVTVPLTKPQPPTPEQSRKKTASTEQVSPSQQVIQQVTHQVTRLLKVIKGEMNRSELMQAVALKDRVNFSKNYLEPAIRGNMVEMTQPDSPKSPTQKYRLTDRGRDVVERIGPAEKRGSKWQKS